MTFIKSSTHYGGEMKIKYQNGYSDGSGKGKIIKRIGKEEHAILSTHWGCSCCDRETTPEDNLLADEVVRILNTQVKEKTK